MSRLRWSWPHLPASDGQLRSVAVLDCLLISGQPDYSLTLTVRGSNSRISMVDPHRNRRIAGSGTGVSRCVIICVVILKAGTGGRLHQRQRSRPHSCQSRQSSTGRLRDLSASGAERPASDIRCLDLVAPKLPFAKSALGVYDTHDAKPRAYQAIASRWLEAPAYPRKPSSICASDQARDGHRAASKEGSGKGSCAGDSQAGWIEMRTWIYAISSCN